MQANLAANAYQDGSGHLVMVAQAGACKDTHGNTFQYSGAQIFGGSTLIVPNPGYLEWYAEMPMVPGVWPTLWTMGIPVTAWPACGETDVAENQTAASTAHTYSTLHYPGRSGAAQYGGGALAASSPAYSAGWHKWGCFWSGTSVEMYLDEVLYWTATETEVVNAGGTWEFDKQQCPYLSIYVGGAGAGNPNPGTAWPVAMTLDWVRCYNAVPYTTS
jgi:beta-glucanase (GH16 family)